MQAQVGQFCRAPKQLPVTAHADAELKGITNRRHPLILTKTTPK
jgi:hypothetical protein